MFTPDGDVIFLDWQGETQDLMMGLSDNHTSSSDEYDRIDPEALRQKAAPSLEKALGMGAFAAALADLE